jgi:Glycosyl transferase family 2
MRRSLRRALSGQALVALCSLAWLAATLEWFQGVRRVPLLREAGKNRDPLGVAGQDEGAPSREAARRLAGQEPRAVSRREEARGEWLLFTDADVRFSPRCLEDAVGYAQSAEPDHLTLATEIISREVALRSFVAAFVLVFEVTQRPWRAADPRAREAVGVGAFNLVRREVYLLAGTHRALSDRPRTRGVCYSLSIGVFRL